MSRGDTSFGSHVPSVMHGTAANIGWLYIVHRLTRYISISLLGPKFRLEVLSRVRPELPCGPAEMTTSMYMLSLPQTESVHMTVLISLLVVELIT